MSPAGRRGRVTATRGGRSWSTTRSATRGLRSWARARPCWARRAGGLLRRRRPGEPVRRARAIPSAATAAGPAPSVRRRGPGPAAFATEDGPEIWCRCDGGPHGFLSIAAHAHADALSLEVRHDGVDILADPGTYCYHGEPEWREWFRSTAAHNTVEIGGVSQAESGGPFLWNTHARTATLTCDVGEQPVQTWSAEHDGYLRLKTPTTHRRSVTLDSPGRRLTVVDTFDASRGGSSCGCRGTSARTSRSIWTERTPPFLAGRTGAAGRGCCCFPTELTWTFHRAEVDPVAGWYSPRFGARVPATSLVGRGMASSSTRLVTELELP